MSVVENRKIVTRAFEELLGQGKLKVADELYAADFTDNGEASGPSPLKQSVAMYHKAFPDLTITIEEQFGCGDKVVSRWRAEGTQQDEFMGAPASGNKGTMRGISVHTVREEQIVSHWGQMNLLSFMKQLGAIPNVQQSEKQSTRT